MMIVGYNANIKNFNYKTYYKDEKTNYSQG